MKFQFCVGDKSVNNRTSGRWQKWAEDDGRQRTQQPTINGRAVKASGGWQREQEDVGGNGWQKGVAASDKSIDIHMMAGDEDESVQWIMKQTEDDKAGIDATTNHWQKNGKCEQRGCQWEQDDSGGWWAGKGGGNKSINAWKDERGRR
jgi:hypothetical protein